MKKLNVTEKIDKLLNGKSCCDIKSIEEINAQYNYKDECPGGNRDKKYVACGQDDKNYNELKEIYEEHLESHINKNVFTKDEAIKALCEVCAEMGKKQKLRTEFYRKLGGKLKISIPD